MPRKPKNQDDYNHPFEFPDKLCNQIGECSPAGFVLFFIDGNGDPDVRLSFSHGMAEGALRDFGARFFNSITQSLDIQEVQGFLGNIGELPPPPQDFEDLGNDGEE